MKKLLLSLMGFVIGSLLPQNVNAQFATGAASSKSALPAWFIQVDNGTRQQTTGVANNQALSEIQWFVTSNPFTPPLIVQNVSAFGSDLCPDQTVDFYVYEDTDANPANGATVVCDAQDIVLPDDVWTSASVTALGGGVCCVESANVYIAAVNRSCNQAIAVDGGPETRRSWFAFDNPNFGEADPPVLPRPSTFLVQPFNWMLRADGWDGQANCVLPVELSSFNSFVENGIVTLQWTTHSELNNSGFEIQHAPATSEDFTPLGWVDGWGSTTEANDYHFVISDLAPGPYRFRLKQMDFDGSSDYSPIINTLVTLPEGYIVSDAYPNPFNPSASIQIGVQETQFVTLEVYNSFGQKVLSPFNEEVEANRMQTVQLSLDGMPSGLYLLVVRGRTWLTHKSLTLAK